MKRALPIALSLIVLALAGIACGGKTEPAIAFISDRDGNNEIYILEARDTATPLDHLALDLREQPGREPRR